MREFHMYPLPQALDILSGFRLYLTFLRSTEAHDRDFAKLCLDGANRLAPELAQVVGAVGARSREAANDARIPADVLNIRGDSHD